MSRLQKVVTCIFVILSLISCNNVVNDKEKDIVKTSPSTTLTPSSTVRKIVLKPELDNQYQKAYKTFHSGNYSEAIKISDSIIKHII